MKRLINLNPPTGYGLGAGSAALWWCWIGYLVASEVRLADNPNDKLLPGFASLHDAIIRRMALPRTNALAVFVLVDTLASLQR